MIISGKSSPKPSLVFLAMICAIVWQTSVAQDYTEEAGMANIKYQAGPATVELGDIAEITLPEGYAATDADGARTIMENIENPTSGLELGLIAPEDFSWFVLFEFEKIGYVKDDEKSDLDSKGILQSIIEQTEESNKERKENGWGTLTIEGWMIEPRYNTETNNLEWATRAVDNLGYYSVNLNTRILGRRGVMYVTLVCEPDSLEGLMGRYSTLMDSFSYKPGSRYGEYVQGDELAKVGLTALILGGGAAVAAKTGLFKWLWKLIVVGIAAISGFFRKLFGKKKSPRLNAS